MEHNPMKVYVAGAWPDAAQVRKRIDQLKELGFEITYDWTRNEKRFKVFADGTRKEHYNAQRMRSDADNDIKGVKQCDALVVCMDYANDARYPYRGTYTEIGAAYALGKPVLIFDPLYDPLTGASESYSATNCFYWKSEATQYRKWEDLVHALRRVQELGVRGFI